MDYRICIQGLGKLHSVELAPGVREMKTIIKSTGFISQIVAFILMMLFVRSSYSQQLPPLDFFVYLDNSQTIFSGGENAPSKRLPEMFEALFSQPVPEIGQENVVSEGDRIYLYTFGDKVEAFGEPIDGGDIDGWKSALGEFSEQTSNDRTTKMDSLFKHLADNVDSQVLNGRQKVVLIASDFIHDPSNSSVDMCAAATALESGLGLVLDDVIESALSRIRRIQEISGINVYFGFLEVVPTINRTGSYHDCFRRVLVRRPITSRLEDVDGVATKVIKYEDLKDDVDAFAKNMSLDILQASLPALELMRKDLHLVDDLATVKLQLKNNGLIANELKQVVLHGVDSNSILFDPDIESRVIGPGETTNLEFDIPRRLVANQDILSVKFEDESPLSFGLSSNLTVVDETALVIGRARISDDLSTIQVTIENPSPEKKALGPLIFYGDDDVESFSLPADFEELEPDSQVEKSFIFNTVNKKKLARIGNSVTAVISTQTGVLSPPFLIDIPQGESKLTIDSVSWVKSLEPGDYRLALAVSNSDESRPEFMPTLNFYSENGNQIDHCQIDNSEILPRSNSVVRFCERIFSADNDTELLQLASFFVGIDDPVLRVVNERPQKFVILPSKSRVVTEGDGLSIKLALRLPGQMGNQILRIEVSPSGADEDSWSGRGANTGFIGRYEIPRQLCWLYSL